MGEETVRVSMGCLEALLRGYEFASSWQEGGREGERKSESSRKRGLETGAIVVMQGGPAKEGVLLGLEGQEEPPLSLGQRKTERERTPERESGRGRQRDAKPT